MEVKLKSPLPIKVSYPPELQIRPKFSNATQGRITAVVEGGTVLPYFQGYIFYWERRDGNTIEEITSQVITRYDTENRKFYIIANNIPKGDYYLMAYDINYYNHPMGRANCLVKDSHFKLEAMPPLTAKIIPKSISCNSQNEFWATKRIKTLMTVSVMKVRMVNWKLRLQEELLLQAMPMEVNLTFTLGKNKTTMAIG